MYDPTHPSSTSTAAVAPVSARPRREAAVLDKVRVAPETFRQVLFMGSAERKEWSQDNRPNREKAQKVDTATLPVWSVQVAAIDWTGKSNLLTVGIPMAEDPAGKFMPGRPVELVGLVLGNTPRRSGGLTIWLRADAITPAGTGQAAA
jgi:hypothetical protein